MPKNTQNSAQSRAATPPSGQLLTADRPAIRAAQADLRGFVFDLANDLATRHGFDWNSVPDAPSTYSDLKRCFAASKTTGQSLPVSDDNSSATVFGTPEANHALRFAHDVLHVTNGLSFNPRDEYVLACEFMDRAENWGIRRGSIAWYLLLSDAVGQALFYAVAKRYVKDQLHFGLDFVNIGLHRALLAEVKRHND
ncbi:hypothetical protein [Glutamicibacter arilaitensis]|uniref:hypothetical protein n=1 Tax=Glutamicibacter arilaitensis TaxID=256701 RepID=UPI003FD37A4A